MKINERIEELRKKMDEENIDVYLVITSDFHESEYLCNFFKTREYISGFTGSAGTVLIFKDESCLWADGRYHVQAEKQIQGTEIKLFKEGLKNVPSYKEYISKKFTENFILGCDTRLVSCNKIKELLSLDNIIIKDTDLISKIWKDRPSLPKEKIFVLEQKYFGVDCKEKITKIRDYLKQSNAEYNIVTNLDDIAWIYNFRGRDIKNNPVALSFTIISNKETYLYIDKEKIDERYMNYFLENEIKIKDYFEFFDDIKKIKNASIIIDENKTSYYIYSHLKDGNKIINKINPSTYIKAHKNDIEIKNTVEAHIEDGIALTKFMYWIKNNYDKNISEYEAGIKIDNLRKEIEDFIEPSFDTISAYNENAAMMHYRASEHGSAIIGEGVLLLDSGGQYLRGTTDTTRTFFLGNVDNEIKIHNTLVLKGMLALSRAKFLYGATGTNLDILARQYLWQNLIDYKCGTGHGVGHILNVHEGPHGIRFQINTQRLEENMVVTNEPGVYITNSHGIRIENELLVKVFDENIHGKFMCFETLTYVPIDIDGIVVSMLNDEEKHQLNEYHKNVYEKLSPHLNGEEKEFLKKYTKNI